MAWEMQILSELLCKEGAMNSDDGLIKDKHLLIAVDETESSRRAVSYVAEFLGGLNGFRVTLMSVIPEPEEDFFDNNAHMDARIKDKTDVTNAMLEKYSKVLIQSGFPEEKVRYHTSVGQAKVYSQGILEARSNLSCCTIVVGSRHKSKSEEFLYGSTSSKLIHDARNCSVWVVE